MSDFKAFRVVSQLPSQLEAGALYLVRAGTGFDLYATNLYGQAVAYPLNPSLPNIYLPAVGMIIPAMWTQNVVTVNGDVWYRLGGQTVPLEDIALYPILADFCAAYVKPPMTSATTPAPLVATSSANFSNA